MSSSGLRQKRSIDKHYASLICGCGCGWGVGWACKYGIQEIPCVQQRFLMVNKQVEIRQ